MKWCKVVSLEVWLQFLHQVLNIFHKHKRREWMAGIALMWQTRIRCKVKALLLDHTTSTWWQGRAYQYWKDKWIEKWVFKIKSKVFLSLSMTTIFRVQSNKSNPDQAREVRTNITAMPRNMHKVTSNIKCVHIIWKHMLLSASFIMSWCVKNAVICRITETITTRSCYSKPLHKTLSRMLIRSWTRWFKTVVK